MSDEEKRLFNEEKRKRIQAEKEAEVSSSDNSPRRGGPACPPSSGDNTAPRPTKKIAEITKVEFLDKNGKVKNVFQTGEDLTVRVKYKINRPVKDPIFGIVIKDDFRKISIFDTNTQFLKIKTGEILKGEKSISFIINNRFATGSFSVSPAIADRKSSILDWKDDLKKFRVINPDYRSSCLIDFDHRIIIDPK